jgi:hypothetical protein
VDDFRKLLGRDNKISIQDLEDRPESFAWLLESSAAFSPEIAAY